MDSKNVLTKDGKRKLEEELRHLIDVEQPEIRKDLAAARAQGDLSENADYTAAMERNAQIESRIQEIQQQLNNAEVIPDSPKSNKNVTLGSYVEVKNLKTGKVTTYKIVGTIEANPLANPPQISNVSPVGKAIVGKKVGEIATVRTNNPFELEIIKISVSLD